MQKLSFDGWFPKVGVAAAALMALGAILPWVKVVSPFGAINIAGTDGDGWLFILGGLGAAALVLLVSKTWPLIIAGLAGVGGALYYMVTIIDGMTELSGDEMVTATLGIGLPVILIGAIALIVLGVKKRPVVLEVEQAEVLV